jgi:drug/metabolite transporter (DMT)-like permease
MNDFGMSAPEFAFVRSFFNMCASRALLGYSGVGVWDGVMEKHHMSLFLRCFAGTFVFTGMMYVVKILPLTIFFMIFQTSPFIVALIAWLWLNESMTSLEGLAMVLSYVGIAMISLSQPVVEDQVTTEQVAIAADSQYTFGIVLSLFLAVNFAIV